MCENVIIFFGITVIVNWKDKTKEKIAKKNHCEESAKLKIRNFKEKYVCKRDILKHTHKTKQKK